MYVIFNLKDEAALLTQGTVVVETSTPAGTNSALTVTRVQLYTISHLEYKTEHIQSSGCTQKGENVRSFSPRMAQRLSRAVIMVLCIFLVTVSSKHCG